MSPISSMAIGKKRKKISRKGDVSDSITPLVACSTTSSKINLTSSSKTICLQGESCYRNVMEWFILKIPFPDLTKKPIKSSFRKAAAFNHDLYHQHKDAAVLPPILSCEKGKGTVPLWGNSLACLGSTIYTIGGSTRESDSSSKLVHYIDTKEGVSGGWKQGPSMITARMYPRVVTLDGKLYVFGCNGDNKCPHENRCDVWAEVLDPKAGQWRPLPNPPLLENWSYTVAAHSTDPEGKHNTSTKGKTILVNTFENACEFDIASGCWTVTKPYFTDQPSAVVDNVVYWVEDEFNAYDIAKGFSFVGPLQDLMFHSILNVSTDVDEDSKSSRPAILHLGGRYFCLLSCVYDAETHSYNIHCLVVKVSRTKKRYQKERDYERSTPKFFLSVSVVSCHSYPVSHHLGFLSGQLMVI